MNATTDHANRGPAPAPARRRWALNPLARKRWNRFRRHRRGFGALCLLLGLYAVSLFAEFICNDKPLYVRYEGRSYFPVVRFYPDDVFTGSGLLTRPDYKQLAQSPAFAESTGNIMVFTPFRHGPYEIINPASLRDQERVEVRVRPRPRVAGIHVGPDMAVTRTQSAEFFLDASFTGRLDEAWAMPEQVVAAIGERLANRASPPVTALATSRTDAARVAEISLLEYRPRRAAPRDVRMTFREAGSSDAAARIFAFGRDGEPVGRRTDWNRMDAAQQAVIADAARRAFEGQTETASLDIGGSQYEVVTRKEEVRWPFRPVPGHWMGIDNAGRDVFARILYGLRTSMTFGLLLVTVSMGFGIVMGAVQGYYGGKVDLVAQRLIEIWSTIPFLYVMILLGSMYGRSFSLLLFCYALFNWIGISYYVRAEFLRLRHAPFVDAARCLGIRPAGIMFRHILPNALTPIITFFPFSLVGAIGALAILDYLGFGLPPPTPSWGEMLQQAQAFRWAWWLILYPSAALFVVMLLGVFMGEGVRDAYDPKPVTRME